MGIEIRYRGRVYTERDIADVREVIAGHPGESRFLLSKELCRLWNGTQPNGTPKDMVCRGLMLLLDREGLITLPGKKRELPWLSPKRATPPEITVDDTAVTGPLSTVPLNLFMVRRTPKERLYQGLVHHYHYLGYTRPVGEHLEYIAFSEGRPIALIGRSSAPRHIGVRDRYLGWSKEERIANLHKIAVNTRFLILPWVKVPHLASHLLGQTARRISSDWERIYHHPLRPSLTLRGGFLGLTTGRGKPMSSVIPSHKTSKRRFMAYCNASKSSCASMNSSKGTNG